MAEMVASAAVQEGFSRVVSFLLDKPEDKSPEEHNIERLEMAVNEVDFVLERTAKMPITDVALLRRRKMLKQAYNEASDLLRRHNKRQAVQVQEGNSQGEKCWIRKFSFSSLLGLNKSKEELSSLNYDDVRRYERFADFARNLLRDLESGFSLRHYTFCCPLVRHLLEGKTLMCQMLQGSRKRIFCALPTCYGDRGVEVSLGYVYEDHGMPHTSFSLFLRLRLSESTDIIGVAINCLQFLASQLGLVSESAVGELTLLANLQDIFQSYARPRAGMQRLSTMITEAFRSDPLCCKANAHGHCGSNTFSPESLSCVFPEEVITFSFWYYIIPAPDQYSLRRSPHDEDEAGRSSASMSDWRPPLEVQVTLLPHIVLVNDLQKSYGIESIGDNREFRYVGMQQAAEMVRSKAAEFWLRQRELTDYGMLWVSKHGVAIYYVRKPSTQRAGVPRINSESETRRSSKRKALEIEAT